MAKSTISISSQVPKNTNATSPCSLRSSIGQGVRRAPRRSHLGFWQTPPAEGTQACGEPQGLIIYKNIILYIYILFTYYIYIIYYLHIIYIYIYHIYYIYIHIIIYFIFNIHMSNRHNYCNTTCVLGGPWLSEVCTKPSQLSLYRCPFLGWATS